MRVTYETALAAVPVAREAFAVHGAVRSVCVVSNGAGGYGLRVDMAEILDRATLPTVEILGVPVVEVRVVTGEVVEGG